MHKQFVFVSRKKTVFVGLAILCLISLVSCGAQSPAFSLTDEKGLSHELKVISRGEIKADVASNPQRVPGPVGNSSIAADIFLNDNGAKKLADGDIAAGGSQAVKGLRVSLEKPYEVLSAGRSVEVDFQSNALAMKAEFFSDDTDSASRILYLAVQKGNGKPGGAGYFPVPKGFEIKSIRLSTLGADKDQAVLTVSDFRIVSTPETASPDSNRVAGNWIQTGNQVLSLNVGALLPEELDASRDYYLRLEYVWDRGVQSPAGSNRIDDPIGLVATGPAGKRFAWDFRVRPGIHSIYIHQAFVGFLASGLEFDKPPKGFGITNVEYGSVDMTSPLSQNGGMSIPAEAFTAPQPIPADLGTILRFPQNMWRQRDFEVFSWSLFPKILLIDFKDVDVQDLFVKRLAFFVEKKNFRGSLLSDKQIEGKHGWNANNYNPEGLASFYNTALSTGFKLNDQELLLRELSLQWGILVSDGSRFKAGTGGVLSVARGAGMSEVTRSVLIQHESLHGAFYELPKFQKTAYAEFDALPAPAKSFIIRFFEFMQYDSADRYLMVNETQAYLLQQSLNGLSNYVTSRIPERIAQVYPDQLAAYVKKAAAALPGLSEAAKRLSDVLYAESGVRNGYMECLLPQ